MNSIYFKAFPQVVSSEILVICVPLKNCFAIIPFKHSCIGEDNVLIKERPIAFDVTHSIDQHNLE